MVQQAFFKLLNVVAINKSSYFLLEFCQFFFSKNNLISDERGAHFGPQFQSWANWTVISQILMKRCVARILSAILRKFFAARTWDDQRLIPDRNCLGTLYSEKRYRIGCQHACYYFLSSRAPAPRRSSPNTSFTP
jgi:hypothetical protein